MLRKIENSSDFLGNEKKSKKDSFIYENFLVKTENDFFYFVSNKNKAIRKYYFDFAKGNEIGKKESSKNIVSNKISVGTFSNYGNYKNSIKDVIYYQGKLYVLDAPYKRILVFSNDKFRDFPFDVVRNHCGVFAKLLFWEKHKEFRFLNHEE